MRSWRLRSAGEPNLGCLLKHHNFCDPNCGRAGCTIYDFPSVGHCLECGAIAECSDNVLLPKVNAYGYGGDHE